MKVSIELPDEKVFGAVLTFRKLVVFNDWFDGELDAAEDLIARMFPVWRTVYESDEIREEYWIAWDYFVKNSDIGELVETMVTGVFDFERWVKESK